MSPLYVLLHLCCCGKRPSPSPAHSLFSAGSLKYECPSRLPLQSPGAHGAQSQSPEVCRRPQLWPCPGRHAPCSRGFAPRQHCSGVESQHLCHTFFLKSLFFLNYCFDLTFWRVPACQEMRVTIQSVPGHDQAEGLSPCGSCVSSWLFWESICHMSWEYIHLRSKPPPLKCQVLCEPLAGAGGGRAQCSSGRMATKRDFECR